MTSPINPQQLSNGNDIHWMREALKLAQQAAQNNEVPVGAILVRDQQLIATGYNQPIALHDPSAHAEIIALRHACKTEQNYRLDGATMYVTLEPCPMCAGALLQARVARVVYAAQDSKGGALGSCIDLYKLHFWHHNIDVTPGICAHESEKLLTEFFQSKRKL